MQPVVVELQQKELDVGTDQDPVATLAIAHDGAAASLEPGRLMECVFDGLSGGIQKGRLHLDVSLESCRCGIWNVFKTRDEPTNGWAFRASVATMGGCPLRESESAYPTTGKVKVPWTLLREALPPSLDPAFEPSQSRAIKLSVTYHRVPTTDDLVHSDEGLEGLNLVREDGLDLEAVPDGRGVMIIPCVNDGA